MTEKKNPVIKSENYIPIQKQYRFYNHLILDSYFIHPYRLPLILVKASTIKHENPIIFGIF